MNRLRYFYTDIFISCFYFLNKFRTLKCLLWGLSLFFFFLTLRFFSFAFIQFVYILLLSSFHFDGSIKVVQLVVKPSGFEQGCVHSVTFSWVLEASRKIKGMGRIRNWAMAIQLRRLITQSWIIKKQRPPLIFSRAQQKQGFCSSIRSVLA